MFKWWTFLIIVSLLYYSCTWLFLVAVILLLIASSPECQCKVLRVSESDGWRTFMSYRFYRSVNPCSSVFPIEQFFEKIYTTFNSFKKTDFLLGIFFFQQIIVYDPRIKSCIKCDSDICFVRFWCERSK